MDTTIPSGGIPTVPFVVARANATAMRSTFWIPVVGLPGRIGWPHISINTLEEADPQ